MKYLNLAFALIVCIVNVVLVSFPLIGLMVLPSLLASVGWASRALHDLAIHDGRRKEGELLLDEQFQTHGVSSARGHLFRRVGLDGSRSV